LNLSLSFQLQGFVISIATGVLLGAYYDVFRIFRTVFQSERRAVFFQDLFYMLSAAFVTFLLSLGVNYGEVRFYILAGEIMGWCLYYLTVGMVTIRVFQLVSKILHKLLINPIKKLLTKIFYFISKKSNIIVGNIKIVAANWKKRLKHHNKIVYNHSNRKRKRNGKRNGKT
jgi:spore cortex biosynthesis protein YabQ